MLGSGPDVSAPETVAAATAVRDRHFLFVSQVRSGPKSIRTWNLVSAAVAASPAASWR
jgi:hypothetical protein